LLAATMGEAAADPAAAAAPAAEAAASDAKAAPAVSAPAPAASAKGTADLSAASLDLEAELREQIAGALADGIDPAAIAAVFASTDSPLNAAIPGGDAMAAVKAAEAEAAAASRRIEYPDEQCVYIGGLEGGEEEIWPEQLAEHFKVCGDIRRVTIKIDKATGDRMGFAYIDFAEEAAAQTALTLDGSMFGTRAIRVNKKRPSEFGKKGKGKGKGKDWWEWGGGYTPWGVTNKSWGKGGFGGKWGPY